MTSPYRGFDLAQCIIDILEGRVLEEELKVIHVTLDCLRYEKFSAWAQDLENTRWSKYPGAKELALKLFDEGNKFEEGAKEVLAQNTEINIFWRNHEGLAEYPKLKLKGYSFVRCMKDILSGRVDENDVDVIYVEPAPPMELKNFGQLVLDLTENAWPGDKRAAALALLLLDHTKLKIKKSAEIHEVIDDEHHWCNRRDELFKPKKRWVAAMRPGGKGRPADSDSTDPVESFLSSLEEPESPPSPSRG